MGKPGQIKMMPHPANMRFLAKDDIAHEPEFALRRPLERRLFRNIARSGLLLPADRSPAPLLELRPHRVCGNSQSLSGFLRIGVEKNSAVCFEDTLRHLLHHAASTLIRCEVICLAETIQIKIKKAFGFANQIVESLSAFRL